MIRWNVFIRFEPHNEVIDARKKINKHVLARINILGSLIDAGITMTRTVRSVKDSPKEGRRCR